jgi:hypothetical protein
MTQNSEWKNFITGLRIDPGVSCSSGDDPTKSRSNVEARDLQVADCLLGASGCMLHAGSFERAISFTRILSAIDKLARLSSWSADITINSFRWICAQDFS